jgi:hypothetical protein
MNVMCNAVFLSEDMPLTFIPQSWRLRDGEVTLETTWTDCNPHYPRYAALIFMVIDFLVCAAPAATPCPRPIPKFARVRRHR